MLASHDSLSYLYEPEHFPDIVHHTMAESTGFLSVCIVMLLLAAAVPGYFALKTGSEGGTATFRKWVRTVTLHSLSDVHALICCVRTERTAGECIAL